MLKLFLSSVAVAVALTGCGDSDRLKQKLETIQHPSEVQVTDVRTALGILGRGETVASLRFSSAYKTHSVSNHYQNQLRKAGWKICDNLKPNEWVEFGDATSGPETTKAQLVIRFLEKDFDGEVRLEQERPKDKATASAPGIGYLRITTPPSESCAAKR